MNSILFTPKVWNKRDPNCPKSALYIGRAMPGLRGSKYQNPYKIGRDGNRPEVLVKYRAHAEAEIAKDPYWLDEFKQAEDVCCWCAPLPCHADVLLELANKE